MRTHHAVDREEIAADEKLAVRLQRDATNDSVRTGAWIETEVQTPVGRSG